MLGSKAHRGVLGTVALVSRLALDQFEEESANGAGVAVADAWNDGPVARPDSPVDHYVHRGAVLVSCTDAIARTEQGPAYRKCGRAGSVWRVMRGGQIPATCVRRI